ncbi:iron dicitrate transport regulator FecR [Longimonas halophila]|uniref:Iron dicitrate transport regulator FecR n=1 Tax=Longimonas halophila TaxID=1469170 RepID=A0A2H3NPY1_9BACT|nr:FecR domain-containing protein [Longimonas halophila]PEN09331.1 iron dicitrate transport regulator FecR [Longimonas halophila]
MDRLFEAVLFYDDLPDERQSDVRRQLAEHPDLRDTLVQWMQVRTAIRRELEADVPRRELLVLYALDESGMTNALNADEQAALNEARPALEEALAAHPGLRDVVARIQEEHADFNAVWDAEVGASHNASANNTLTEEALRHDAPDRAADDYSWALRLAAGVALILVAVSVAFLLPSSPDSTTVDVGAGEAETITLADGSSVRLSGVTRFTYPEEVPDDDAPYVVSIQTGKAFFDVTPRAERTFVVETPTATAEVLGTQFGVDTAPNHTDITLAEGALRVGAPDAPNTARHELAPGQATRVARDQAPTPPQDVNVNDALAWTGLFLFQQTPVERIAASLSTAYDVSITVDSDLAQEPVTGTFEREQPVDDVLDALAATLGASVERSASTPTTYRLVATP